MALSEEDKDDYKQSLMDLKFNSKPQINMLTMLAEDHQQHASDIVAVIEEHITKCKPDKKLPCLYLIDSIMKNLEKSGYRSTFARNIVQTFTTVFEQVDEKTRAAMFKLRQTWSSILPNQKMYLIDVKINKLHDPAWPITATPDKASIHVNPKFLHSHSEGERSSPDEPEPDDDAERQEALMRQQLIAKQQELLRLQEARLELELAEAQEKLKAKKPAKSGSKMSSLPLPSVSDMEPLPEQKPAPRDPRPRPSDPRLRDPRLKRSEPAATATGPSVFSSSSSTPPSSQPGVSGVYTASMNAGSMADMYSQGMDPMNLYNNGLPMAGGMPPSSMQGGPYPGMEQSFPGEGHGHMLQAGHYSMAGAGGTPGHGHGHYPGYTDQSAPWLQHAPGHQETTFKGEVFDNVIARFSDDNDSDSSRSSFQDQSHQRQHQQPQMASGNVRDPRSRDPRANIDPRQRHSHTDRPNQGRQKHSHAQQSLDPRMGHQDSRNEHRDPRKDKKDPRMDTRDPRLNKGASRDPRNVKQGHPHRSPADEPHQGKSVKPTHIESQIPPHKSASGSLKTKPRSVSKERETKVSSRHVSKEKEDTTKSRSVSKERESKDDYKSVPKESVRQKESLENYRRRSDQPKVDSSKSKPGDSKPDKSRTSRERDHSPQRSQRSPAKQSSNKTSHGKAVVKGRKSDPKPSSSAHSVKPDSTSGKSVKSRKSDSTPAASPVKRVSKSSSSEKLSRDARASKASAEEKTQSKSVKRRSEGDKPSEPMDTDDRSFKPSTSIDIEKRMREKEILDSGPALKKPKLESFTDNLEEIPEMKVETEDISDLFGEEDEDYRSVDPVHAAGLPLKSPRDKAWDAFKADKDEYKYDVALKKQRQDSVVELEPQREEEEPQDLDFRVGGPPLQHQTSTQSLDSNTETPGASTDVTELSVNRHGDILLEAHKRLQAGVITKEAYQDLVKQLSQLVQIHQLQQEQSRRLSSEGVTPTTSQTNSDMRPGTQGERQLAELIFKSESGTCVKDEPLDQSGTCVALENMPPDLRELAGDNHYDQGGQDSYSRDKSATDDHGPPALMREPERDVKSPERPLGHFRIPKKSHAEKEASDEDQRRELSNLYPRSPPHNAGPREHMRGAPSGPHGNEQGREHDEAARWREEGVSGRESKPQKRVLLPTPDMPPMPRHGMSDDQHHPIDMPPFSDRPGPPDDRRPPFNDRPGPPDDRRPPFSDRPGPPDDRRPAFNDRPGPPDDRRPPFNDRPGPPDDRRPPFNDRPGPPDDRRPPFNDRPGLPDDRHPPFNNRPGPPDNRRPPFNDQLGQPDDRRPPFNDRPGPPDDRFDRRGPTSEFRGPHGRRDERGPPEGWQGTADSRKGPEDMRSPRDDWSGPVDKTRGPHGRPHEDMDRRGPPGRFGDGPFDRDDMLQEEMNRGGPDDMPRERSGSFGRRARPHDDGQAGDWGDMDERAGRDRFHEDKGPQGRFREDRGRGHVTEDYNLRGGPDRPGPRGKWNDLKYPRGENRGREEDWPRDWDNEKRRGPEFDERRGPGGDRRNEPRRPDNFRDRSPPPGQDFRRDNIDPKTGLPPWGLERDEGPGRREGWRDQPGPRGPREEQFEPRGGARFRGRGRGRGFEGPRMMEGRGPPGKMGPPGPHMRGPKMDGPQGPHTEEFKKNDHAGPNKIEKYVDKFNDPRFRCFADMGPAVSEEVVIGRRNFEIKLGAPPRRIQWHGSTHVEVFADPAKRGIVIDGNLVYKFGERVKEVSFDGWKEKVFYHGRPLNIWFDGQVFEVRVDSPPKQINVNDKPHRIQIDGRDMMILIDKDEKGKFGGEPRFVFIDEERMEMRFDPPPRTIRIDGNLCELKLNTDQPSVNINGVLHGIRFDGPPRDVFIDGKLYQIFTDHAVKLRVGHKFHYVALGGPCHELIVDGRWFEVKFNEAPKEISYGNTVLHVKLPGQPPDVKILGPLGAPPAPGAHMHGPVQPGGPIRGPHPGPVQPGAALQMQGPPPGLMTGPPPMVGALPPGARPLVPPPGLPPQLANMVRPGMPTMPLGLPNSSAALMPTTGPPPSIPMIPGIIPGIGPPVSITAPSVSSGAAVSQPASISNLFSTLFSGARPPAPTQGPASATPPNPLDINSLLDKLVTQGLLKKDGDKPTDTPAASNVIIPTKKQAPKEVFADIPDMTEFDPVLMKSLSVGAIQRLHCGIQCMSCGQRFSTEVDTKSDVYKRHLDWHFRQNKREKEESSLAQCRKWYYGIEDWIQYEEVIDDDDQGKSNFFEQQQQQLEAPATKSQQSLSVVLPEGVSVVRCPAATGNENEDMCNICREPFEQFWDEELEEWHLRDAIKVDGKTYHPICFEDHTDASEGTPSPSVLNVTEPGFTPSRKMLTYEEAAEDSQHMSFEEERQVSAADTGIRVKTEPAEDPTEERDQSERPASPSTDGMVRVKTEPQEATSYSVTHSAPTEYVTQSSVTIKYEPSDTHEPSSTETNTEQSDNTPVPESGQAMDTKVPDSSMSMESAAAPEGEQAMDVDNSHSDVSAFNVAIKDEPSESAGGDFTSYAFSSSQSSIPGLEIFSPPSHDVAQTEQENTETREDKSEQSEPMETEDKEETTESVTEPSIHNNLSTEQSAMEHSEVGSVTTGEQPASEMSAVTDSIKEMNGSAIIPTEQSKPATDSEEINPGMSECDTVQGDVDSMHAEITGSVQQGAGESLQSESCPEANCDTSSQDVPTTSSQPAQPSEPVESEQSVPALSSSSPPALSQDTTSGRSTPEESTDRETFSMLNTSQSPRHLGVPETGSQLTLSPTSFSRLSNVNLAVRQEPVSINTDVLEIGSNASTPTRDELPSPEDSLL